jgi:hypothetical protein
MVAESHSRTYQEFSGGFSMETNTSIQGFTVAFTFDRLTFCPGKRPFAFDEARNVAAAAEKTTLRSLDKEGLRWVLEHEVFPVTVFSTDFKKVTGILSGN